MAAALLADAAENTFDDEPVQITTRGLAGGNGELLVVSVGDASVALEMGDGLPLPFTQPEPGQHLLREPVTPEGKDERALTQLEIRRGQAGVMAECDHALGAGAGLFDVAGEIERLGDERIVRHRGVIVLEIVARQRAGSAPGFQTSSRSAKRRTSTEAWL